MTFDPSVDAAYLYLQDTVESGCVKETVVVDEPAYCDASIHLDFDRDGRLVGIEFLNAKAVLSAEVLAAATFPGLAVTR